MPRSFLFVLVLLSLSLGLNVKLAWKMRELSPTLPPNKVGIQVKSFAATDLEGHTVDISFNTSKPTLIYYIDPQCHWCKVNSDSFDTLARAVSNDARVVILSRRTEKMEQFLADAHPPDPVLIIKSQKVIRDLGLTATPQTFLVNSDGRIERHWNGAYTGQNRAEIEKTFHLHLPDMRPPA